MATRRTRRSTSYYNKGRYRLRPQAFQFRFIDGQLTETTTGLGVFHTATQEFVGNPAPPAPDRPPRTLYLNSNGSPADATSGWLLRRDMTNYLCVLLCRLCPEPQRDDDTVDRTLLVDTEDWERMLEAAGLGEGLPPLFFKPTRSQRQRKFTEFAPAEWQRAIARRLGLFFGRGQQERIILRMAGYFTQVTRWNRWKRDPELQVLVQQWARDERLQRLISIVEAFTYQRARVAAGKTTSRQPCRLVIVNPTGKYVFIFPALEHRRGETARRQQEIHRVLWRASPVLITGRRFDARWIAAAVWIGREFLERPKKLASLRLTQDNVAVRFGLTRRQVRYAAEELRQADFSTRLGSN